MTRTGFLLTAYDKSMEQYLLLFLLVAMKNPEMKESLSSALSFYRENRELITMLLNGATKEQEKKPPVQQENRPREEVGSFGDIEEFLKSRL